MKKILLILLCTYFFVCIPFFISCSNNSLPPGVVARVNGENIFIDDIESRYDLFFFDWSEPLPPSVSEVKATYGRVLLDIILMKIIEQELISKGMDVSEDDVLHVENDIRSDYPEGEFDKMLIEEYIDLHYWRTQVRYKLLWERFVDRVLKPGINVELDEIQDYYYSHIDDFIIPQRIVFLYLGSQDQEMLEKVISETDSFEDIDEIRAKFNIVIGRYEMRLDQLPHNLAGDLKTLSPGDFSRVRGGDQEIFYTLHVLERKDEVLLKPHQVYGIIENNLVRHKLENAFDQWLVTAFSNFNIEINSVLLEKILDTNPDSYK